ESLWRIVFQKTLPAADRDLISKKHFVYSSLTTDTLFDSLSSLRPQPRLDTRGYDFAIFEDARPVRIHPGTIKICRYHDAVPISQVDTQSGPWWTRAHFNSVNRCKLDSFWVCNSPGTK